MTADTVDLNKIRQLKALKKALFGKWEVSHKDPLVKAVQWAHREHLVSVKPLSKGTCQIALTGPAIALLDEHGHLVP